MGRVSDPESMSVSSSQHNCSEEEVVVTSHMKFASDIAALDKRDKELVWYALVVIKALQYKQHCMDLPIQ